MRRYIIGRGWGPHPAAAESPKIKNLRLCIIGRGWGLHPAAAESPKEKEREKGKPKNHKFEALYNREGLGPPPGSSGKPKREGKRERKAQKSEI